MHRFLKFLVERSPDRRFRYGAVLGALALVTLVRIVAPLDAAPFLLYLPVVFLISVAFGGRAGMVCTVIAAVLAASFFDHEDPGWLQLTRDQWIAVVEFILVGTGMVEVCVALRRNIFDSRRSLFSQRASETRLQTVYDTVPVGILLADAPSGAIAGGNKRLEEMLRHPVFQSGDAESYGDWIAFHADGSLVQSHEFPLPRIVRGNLDEARLECHYQRGDGTLMWMDIVGAAMRAPDGTLTGAVVIVIDIDARKQAEEAQAAITAQLAERTREAEAALEAAEAANRAKSAFLANMSHELRTPLSAVIGYTELLEEDAGDSGDTTVLGDLGRIKSNAKHLLSLINDVLDLSKVEANKMEIVAEEIDVAAFSRDAVATVDALARTKSNRLTLTLAEPLGTMRSDAMKLRQCLFNLLSNASKFTQNGTIDLTVERERGDDGDWLVFAVADTGIGMTADQIARLFQRFSQADETTTRRFGGTGLGLALSRAFSRLLGGDIGVTSEFGKGTRFTLRVPAALPDAEVATPGEGVPADHTHKANGDLVLVIDDEASQREVLSRFLARQNFTVRLAADGRTGLELARSLLPRVILLDVMMPEMDGWSVLRTLKADPATAEIPVVLVSFVADLHLGSAMGAAAAAVPKPVAWPALKAVLDQYRAQGGDVLVVDDDRDTRDRLRVALERSGLERPGGRRRRGGAGARDANAAADDRARSDDAGDGRIHLPASPARGAGLRRHPGDRAERPRHHQRGARAAARRRPGDEEGRHEPARAHRRTEGAGPEIRAAVTGSRATLKRRRGVVPGLPMPAKQ